MKRIAEIDGLRAIAALLVMSFHYLNNTLINNHSTLVHLIVKTFSFGWMGVDLFFVLSGFLIGSVLFINKVSNKYFSVFYVRRFVRIVPNYFLLLVLYFFIMQIPFFKNSTFLADSGVIPFWSYFLMLHNIYMGMACSLGNSSLSVTWSIGIEEQFYLIAPVVVKFVKTKFIPALLFVFIVVAIGCRSFYENWIPKYVFLYCRMDSLAIGILTAYLNQHINLLQWITKYKQKIQGLAFTLFVVCAFCYYKFGDLGVYKHTLFAVLFAIAILFALHGNTVGFYRKFLRNKALTFLGKLSYSLYLFHYLLLGVVFYILFQKDPTNPLIPYAHKAAGIGLSVAVSFIFSYCVYQFLEEPVMAIGKKYKY